MFQLVVINYLVQNAYFQIDSDESSATTDIPVPEKKSQASKITAAENIEPNFLKRAKKLKKIYKPCYLTISVVTIYETKKCLLSEK